MAKLAPEVEGDAAEFGVYEGEKTLLMERTLGRKVWAWDTFEGMPDDNYIESLDKMDPPGKWTPGFDVIKSFTDKNIEVVKGKFSDTIPAFGREEVKFAFVHVDCDHYWAYKRVLAFITPRMSPGGIVKLDDYECCAGAKKATDEWCSETGHKLNSGEWIQF